MRKQERTENNIKADRKEKILDQRKKQILSRLRTDENVRTIKVSKKPLKKIGFLIVFLAIIGLLATNTSPWYYMKFNYQDSNSGRIYSHEEFFYSYHDLDNIDEDNPAIETLLTPETSYYNGVFRSFLHETPTDLNIGFSILLALGIAIVLFEFYDKKKGFSFEFFTSVQAIIYSLMFFPTIFISASVMRFIGSYFLVAHHFGSDFQNIIVIGDIGKTEVEFFISPAAIIVILIVLFLIIIVFTVVETDLRTILKEIEKKKKEKNKPKTKLFGDKKVDGR